MQDLIEFCRGPLFRLTFLIMVFGLIRILILNIWGGVDAYRRAGDKRLDWKNATFKTLQWLFPSQRVFTKRPIYSVISILFHIGLIIVPIFLISHIQLWEESTGAYWWSLSDSLADTMTLVTIGAGLALFLGRLVSSNARFLSRKQDYLWPLLLIIPFITGYLCANSNLSPTTYQLIMLVHLLSSELIFVLMPFTKIAHCAVMPLSQFVISLAWKFPARIDERLTATFNKKETSV